MGICHLPLEQLQEAPWNPNQMDTATVSRLTKSIQEFGCVQNLVVRQLDNHRFEVLSGNQRLKVLRELGVSPVPCYLIALDDARAKLLCQALNRIHGEDDLALKAEVIRDLLKTLNAEEITSILPDSKLDLQGLANLGQDTLARYLQNWDQARSLKLRNLQFRLSADQLELVQNVLHQFMIRAQHVTGNNPNTRGNALYLLCQNYLERRSQ